jgi:hypothetical protein
VGSNPATGTIDFAEITGVIMRTKGVIMENSELALLLADAVERAKNVQKKMVNVLEANPDQRIKTITVERDLIENLIPLLGELAYDLEACNQIIKGLKEAMGV